MDGLERKAPGKGSTLIAGASPSLNDFLRDGFRDINDPATGQPLYGPPCGPHAAVPDRGGPCAHVLGVRRRPSLATLVALLTDVWNKQISILGSGSDYTVFLAKLGVASTDLAVRRPVSAP